MTPPSYNEMRRVRISDGYNTTPDCLMNPELGVIFLQNPIIRVLKWKITSHNNTRFLYITDFTTVCNTVGFPLLGTPTDLNSSPGPETPKTECSGGLTTTVTAGVLRPGRDLNLLVSNILTAMTEHYTSGNGRAPLGTSHNRISNISFKKIS